MNERHLTLVRHEMQQKYNALKVLIDTRLQTEGQMKLSTDAAPTTYNFTDLDGYGLIHYAAIIGDCQQISEILGQHANVNLIFSDYNLPLFQSKKNPLQLALEHGQLAVAKLLYEKGAKIDDIYLAHCKTQECKDWLIECIKKLLLTNESDIKKNRYQILIRLAEINDLSSFKELMYANNAEINNKSMFNEDFREMINKDNAGQWFPPEMTIFNAAVMSGNTEFVAFLISNGFMVNPVSSYKTSPLICAMISNNNQMVDFLIKHGADIAYQDNMKYSVLMHAVMQGNILVVNKLLELNADITQTTVDGDNILHIAAQYAKKEIWDRLMLHPGLKKIAGMKNIYGFTPEDYSYFHGNHDALSSFLKSNDIALFKSDHRYLNPPVAIQQMKIIQRIYYYSQLHYRNMDYISIHGYCNGLVFLCNLHSKTQGLPHFYSCLQALASWDGSQEGLKKPLTFESGSKLYKNIGELFEQWINDIIYFYAQQQAMLTDLKTMPKHHDRVGQLQWLEGKEVNAKDLSIIHLMNGDYLYNKLASYAAKNLNKSPEQLLEILKYLFRMPENIRCELSADGHVVSLLHDEISNMYFYDPNHVYQTIKQSSGDILAHNVLDYLYIRRGEYKSSLYANMNVYLFLSDYHRINWSTVKLFEAHEIPKSKQEAMQFQEKSPNQLTPLHIALMAHHTMCLQELLKTGLYDVNAKDAAGVTPLEAAIYYNCEQGVRLLLQQPHLNDSKQIISAISLAAQLERQEILLVLLQHAEFDKVKQSDEAKQCITKLLFMAYKNNDHFFDYYMKHHLNELEFFHAPITIQEYTGSLIAASVLFFNEEQFGKMIAVLKSKNTLNELDYSGYSLIYYAVNFNNLVAFQKILAEGGDINCKTKTGLSLLSCIINEYQNLQKVMDSYQQRLTTIKNLYDVAEKKYLSLKHQYDSINEQISSEDPQHLLIKKEYETAKKMLSNRKKSYDFNIKAFDDNKLKFEKGLANLNKLLTLVRENPTFQAHALMQDEKNKIQLFVDDVQYDKDLRSGMSALLNQNASNQYKIH